MNPYERRLSRKLDTIIFTMTHSLSPQATQHAVLLKSIGGRGFSFLILLASLLILGLSASHAQFPLAPFKTKLAVGLNYTLVLRDDGTVWASGNNSEGQLGQNPTILSSTSIPTQVPGLTSIVSVAAGDNHALALKNDGTVYSWGRSNENQLGRSIVSVPSYTPGIIAGISGATSISAGATVGYAIVSGGNIKAWGNNTYYALGTNTTSAATPTNVLNVTNAIKVTTSDKYISLALTSNGQVWKWANSAPIPVLVAGSSGAVDIAAPSDGLVVRNDGKLFGVTNLAYWEIISNTVNAVSINCVRDSKLFFLRDINNNVYLGFGSNNPTPTLLNTIPSSVELAVGGFSNLSYRVKQAESYNFDLTLGPSLLSLSSDGYIFGTGVNVYGQLGDGSSTRKTVPAQLSKLTKVKKVELGAFVSAALTTDNKIYIWGDSNAFGQYGNGSSGAHTTVTSEPKLLLNNGVEETGVTDIAVGEFHLLYVKNGLVYVWGCTTEGNGGGYLLNNGQLGLGNTTTTAWVPTQVSGLSSVTNVFAARGVSFALLSTKQARSWGNGVWGALSSGNQNIRYTPGTVLSASGTALTNVKSISTNGSHTLFLLETGVVRTSGIKQNAQGVTTSGYNLYANTGSQVASISNVTHIAASTSAINMAISNVGSVNSLYTWGYYVNGTSGYGNGVPQYAAYPPYLVYSGGSLGAQIGNSFSACYVLFGDALRAWGKNEFGELATGNYQSNYTAPATNSTITGMKEVGGDDFSCAYGIKSHTDPLKDGTVWVWGDTSALSSGINRPLVTQMGIRVNATLDDTDGDGLNDVWEIATFGDLSHNGAEDADADGSNNIQELEVGTNVNLADTDGDGFNDSSDGFPLDVTNNAAPTGLAATSNPSKVILTWNYLPGRSYQIIRSSSPTGGAPIASNINGGSFEDVNVTSGATYYYRINSTFVGNTTPDSAPVTISVPIPAIPTGLIATTNHQGIQLSWNESLGAVSYQITRAVNGGAYSPIGNPLAPPYIDSTATNDLATYYYKIAAVGSNGVTGGSTAPVLMRRISPPSSVVITPSPVSAPTQGTLTWGVGSVPPGNPATAYKVLRSPVSGANYVEVATTPTIPRTFTDLNMSLGTRYYYVLQTVNANGASAYSNEVSAMTVPPPPTGLAVVSQYGPYVTLNWNTALSATSYTVLRSSVSGSGYFPVANNVSGTAFMDNTVQIRGVNYYYVVRANNEVGQSANSSEVQAYVPMPPSGLTATVHNNHVSLNWNLVPGAVSYRVFRSKTSAQYESLRVSEIMYHPKPPPAPVPNQPPPPPEPKYVEFIELTNKSNTYLDLGGAYFFDGDPVQGTGSTKDYVIGNVSLHPGGFGVVLHEDDIGDFTARNPGVTILGTWSGDRDDEGDLKDIAEKIRLKDKWGNTMPHSYHKRHYIYYSSYSWDPLWPSGPGGFGPSLEVLSLTGDYDDPNNWISSEEDGGSPGLAGQTQIAPVPEFYEPVSDIMTGTSFSDTSIVSAGNYFYVVKAYNAQGLSDQFNEVDALYTPIRTDTGFRSTSLPFSQSSVSAPLGFTLKIFNSTYTNIYVNNKGNLTFDYSLFSASADKTIQQNGMKIIAGLFAPVSRVTGDEDDDEPDSENVKYGQGWVNGHKAFGATYINVASDTAYYRQYNDFQIIIIQREDLGDDEYDIEFNYENILYESNGIDGLGGYNDSLVGYSPQVGISNGIDRTLEFSGSGISGAFLNSNSNSGLIHGSRGVPAKPGRYIIEIRNGKISGALQVNAGADQILNPGTSQITLASIGSSDPDGGTISYQWTQIVKSQNQQLLNIQNGQSANASISHSAALPPGDYYFRLTITKNNEPLISASDEVKIKVNP